MNVLPQRLFTKAWFCKEYLPLSYSVEEGKPLIA